MLVSFRMSLGDVGVLNAIVETRDLEKQRAT